MQHRRDIDGLRALAVVPVVLFHAFPQWIPGGYVGVDIFFVISGFLITGLLLKSLDQGQFSLLDFYERRGRRILPALAVVLLFCLLVSLFVYLPADLHRFGQGLGATGVFASNIFFWRTSGYFDSDSELSLLLHTWSLSVEEQFYLFFPPVLFLITRYARRYRTLVLWCALVLSFVACAWLTRLAPSFAFYRLPTRAWELLLGGVLAAGGVPAVRSPGVRQFLATSGLGLIVFSVFSYSKETSFPGIAALAPVVGAALIIHAGTGHRQPLAWLIERQLLVWIGLISYSLYLWHWPLLSVLRYWAVEHPSTLQMATAVALSFLFAYASYRWVETPIRQRRVLVSARGVFIGSGAMIVGLVLVGAVISARQGFPERVPAQIAALSSVDAASRLRNPDRLDCLRFSENRMIAGELCRIGQSPATATGPQFLLWGDSHAETLRSGLAAAASPFGQWGYFVGGTGCPPLLDLRRYDKEAGDACRDSNRKIVEWVAKEKIPLVFLSARWALNHWGTRYRGETGERALLAPGSTESNPQIVAALLEKTVTELERAGAAVVLVAGIPEIGLNVPKTMALRMHFDRQVRLEPSWQEYWERNSPVLTLFESMQSRHASLRVADPGEKLCSKAHDRCQVELDGQPFYSDDDHLSIVGSEFIADIFVPAFQKVSLVQP